MIQIKKNPTVGNTTELFLEMKPSERRDDESKQEQDGKNIFTHDVYHLEKPREESESEEEGSESS